MSETVLSDGTKFEQRSRSSSSSSPFESLTEISKEKKDAILRLFQFDLKRHRMNEVLELYRSNVVPEIRKNLSFIVWDLVPIICQRLRGLSKFRFKTFSVCQEILLDLCEICNPKELLIIYLAELENDLCATKMEKLAGNSKLETQTIGENDLVNNFEEKCSNDINQKDDEICDSNCFKALLKPFEVILLKLPRKRNETLKSILSSLNDHINQLSISPIYRFDFEKDNRSKLQTDPVMKNTNLVLMMYIDFLTTFVNEVSLDNPNQSNHYHAASRTSDPQIQRTILLKTLLLVLYRPLRLMDLYDHDLPDKSSSSQIKDSESKKPSTKKNQSVQTPPLENQIILQNSIMDNSPFVASRSIANKVCYSITKLHPNFLTLLQRTDLISSDEEIESNTKNTDLFLSREKFQFALSVLSYILEISRANPIVTTLSRLNFLPKIYTHIYNLSINLPLIQCLLKEDQFTALEKGLDLLHILLQRIEKNSIEPSFIDLLKQHPIDKSLISIMVFSSYVNSRVTALNLFKELVLCFEHLGRYKILYSILSSHRIHAGFQGVAISLYKNFVFDHPIYQGANLHRLIRAIIGILQIEINPDDNEINLLEKNDLVFGTINFLRYIMIRDKRSTNSTRIWDIAAVIRENFIKPVQATINMRRLFYKFEMHNLPESKSSDSIASATSLNLTKHSQYRKFRNLLKTNDSESLLMNNVEKEDYLKEMGTIKQNFDLIESILTRLIEIMDE
uniref:Glomulin n=1 Tax=Sarcoptes scabiei TaxID=52283 RepID=A0A834RBC7_SARSC